MNASKRGFSKREGVLGTVNLIQQRQIKLQLERRCSCNHDHDQLGFSRNCPDPTALEGSVHSGVGRAIYVRYLFRILGFNNEGSSFRIDTLRKIAMFQQEGQLSSPIT